MFSAPVVWSDVTFKKIYFKCKFNRKYSWNMCLCQYDCALSAALLWTSLPNRTLTEHKRVLCDDVFLIKKCFIKTKLQLFWGTASIYIQYIILFWILFHHSFNGSTDIGLDGSMSFCWKYISLCKNAHCCTIVNLWVPSAHFLDLFQFQCSSTIQLSIKSSVNLKKIKKTTVFLALLFWPTVLPLTC